MSARQEQVTPDLQATESPHSLSVMPEHDPLRITSLDSVRGIAALVVVFWHNLPWLMYRTGNDVDWLLRTPLRALINGDGAVILFFVLSGFVLTLPYLGANPPRYKHFMLRRLCRICIPYYAALAVAIGLYWVMDKNYAPDMRIWMDGVPLTAATVAHHCLSFLIGTDDSNALNGATWSLVHELRIAVLFPVLIWLMRRPVVGIVVTIILYTLALWAIGLVGQFNKFPDTTDDIFSGYLVTLYFVPCFMLGIALAAHQRRIMGFLTRLPDWVVLLLWVLVWGIFCYFDSYKLRQPLVMAAAGGLIMLAQLPGVTAAILQSALLRWLGRISYSLYLVHLPLNFFMAQQWGGVLPPACDTLGIVGASLAVATLMHRYVEIPAMALGRRLTRPSDGAA